MGDKYVELGEQIGKLVAEKQVAYGDSFGKSGKIMSILYPDGIRAEQMKDALAVVRVIDKLFRIASKKDAFGESPWKDIAGYALLGWGSDENDDDFEIPEVPFCEELCKQMGAATGKKVSFKDGKLVVEGVDIPDSLRTYNESQHRGKAEYFDKVQGTGRCCEEEFKGKRRCCEEEVKEENNKPLSKFRSLKKNK